MIVPLGRLDAGRQPGVHHIEGAVDVHVDERLQFQLAARGLVDVFANDDAGVVDQDVDGTDLACSLLGELRCRPLRCVTSST